MTKKALGFNYLIRHQMLEQKMNADCGEDHDHVIIDKKEYFEILDFFKDNPILVDWIGKGRVAVDNNTNEFKEYRTSISDMRLMEFKNMTKDEFDSEYPDKFKDENS